MASSISMAMLTPIASVSVSKSPLPSSDAFLKPLPVRSMKQVSPRGATNPSFKVGALKEKATAGATAAGLAASMVVPEVAQAVDGVSPSLKNFLLSIVAGGVVLAAIGGAVVAVANFDPVKRA